MKNEGLRVKKFNLIVYLCKELSKNSLIMSLKKLLLPLLFMSASPLLFAEMVTEYILDTVDSGEGYWPCLFYELNYNTDIPLAEKAAWYSPDEDESYWREGVGPFSIDQNKFFVTQWQSTVHPILIRRHFTLTAEDLLKVSIGAVTLTYSYDENPTFWLNGTKIASATGWNDNNYASLRFTAARKKLLVEGDNVLCVSLQQGAGGGHIDYGLNIMYNTNHTGLERVESSEFRVESPAYDLNGRSVNNNAKGIVVTKGKKTIKK